MMLYDTQKVCQRFLDAGMSEKAAIIMTYALHDAVLQSRGLPPPSDRKLFHPPEEIEKRIESLPN
jgi:hypothetical protein